MAGDREIALHAAPASGRAHVGGGAPCWGRALGTRPHVRHTKGGPAGEPRKGLGHLVVSGFPTGEGRGQTGEGTAPRGGRGQRRGGFRAAAPRRAQAHLEVEDEADDGADGLRWRGGGRGGLAVRSGAGWEGKGVLVRRREGGVGEPGAAAQALETKPGRPPGLVRRRLPRVCGRAAARPGERLRRPRSRGRAGGPTWRNPRRLPRERESGNAFPLVISANKPEHTADLEEPEEDDAGPAAEAPDEGADDGAHVAGGADDGRDPAAGRRLHEGVDAEAGAWARGRRGPGKGGWVWAGRGVNWRVLVGMGGHE